jgi:hypothetical protein
MNLPIAIVVMSAAYAAVFLLLRGRNVAAALLYWIFPVLNVLLSLIFLWAYGISEPALVLMAMGSFAIGGLGFAWVLATFTSSRSL